MKKLEYEFNKHDIIRMLGYENFENKYSALYELVKNSHDASATELKIKFTDQTIELSDNGSGMDEKTIEDSWMQVGTSSKRNSYDFNGRVLTGAKGIGRLSLIRLGSRATIETNCGKSALVLKTDWEDAYLENVNYNIQRGTKIIISELTEKWNKKDIEELIIYLSKMINSSKMKIAIESKWISEDVINVFDLLQEKIHYFMDFNFHLKGSILKICINNKNLFEQSIFKNGLHDTKVIDIDLKDKKLFSPDDISLLPNLNNVNGKFYYGFQIRKADKQKFKYRIETNTYKKLELFSKPIDGVILYRNNFSVSGYEGKNDWLGLGTRVSKSPAAASHPNGSYRFRKQNILGQVNIDRKENVYLEDMANRQGLAKNDTFELLLKVIDTVFVEAEKYYQNIIRIVIQDHKETSSFNKSLETFDKAVQEYAKKTPEQRQKMYLKNSTDAVAKHRVLSLKEEIENLKYDAFYLETYATNGMLVNTISHDLKNNIKNLKGSPRNLENTLRELNYWDKLLKETKGNIKARNIELIMNSLYLNTKKIDSSISRFLDGIKKEKFEYSEIILNDYFKNLKDEWEKSKGNINIKYTSNVDILKFHESSLDIIFNNLIDNSVKNNKTLSINIIIDIKLEENNIYITYEDDGCGLSVEFRENPYEILEVHKTTHSNSQGLGMWIINNRLKLYEGYFDYIKPKDNFLVKMKLCNSIGEKND